MTIEDRRQTPNRTIMLYGDINKQVICDVMQQIIHINEYDDYQEELYGEKYIPQPIKLRICSGGGELAPTVGLIEEILHSRTPIISVVEGEACSAAFLIFIVCHHRYYKLGSTMMMHSSKAGFGGSLKTIQNDVKSYERMEKHMRMIIEDATKIPKSLIDKYYNEQLDYYFTPEECVEYGICDEIYGCSKEEIEPEKEKSKKKKTKKGKKK